MSKAHAENVETIDLLLFLCANLLIKAMQMELFVLLISRLDYFKTKSQKSGRH